MRNRVLEQEENSERWLVSYADFMTLLFAFFVVMYSISQVNQSKYQALSESLFAAFDRPTSDIPTSEMPRSAAESAIELEAPSSLAVEPVPSNPEQTKEPPPEEEQNYASPEEFSRIKEHLSDSLADLIDKELVSIRSNKNWLEIDLRSALLFDSGSDRLHDSADILLKEIAGQLIVNEHLISIRGHTDNIPIDTQRFASNWELSAARSVAVVRVLQKEGVLADRLTVEAHGEYQPIASNDDEVGRAKNRRVTVAVSRYRMAVKKPPEKTVEAQPPPQPQEKSKPKQPKKKLLAPVNEEMGEPNYEIIRLPEGGLLIRGKPLPEKKSSPSKPQSLEGSK